MREMSVKGQIYPLKTMFTREMTVKCPPTFFGSDLDLKSQKLACVLGLTVRKPVKTRVGARFGTLSIKPRVNLTSKFGKFAFVTIFSAFASEHLRFQSWPWEVWLTRTLVLFWIGQRPGSLVQKKPSLKTLFIFVRNIPGQI